MRKEFKVSLAVIIVLGLFFVYNFKGSIITGMAVGRGLLLSQPGYGSLVMIIILAAIVTYYNKERIKKLFK